MTRNKTGSLTALAFGFVSLTMLLPTAAFAHARGEHYVFIDVKKTGLVGRFSIRFDDLNKKLGIEIDQPGRSPEEIAAAAGPRVQAYIREHWSLEANGREVEPEFGTTGVFDDGNVPFAEYLFRMTIDPMPDVLTIEDRMLFEGDKIHRGLLCINENARTGEVYGGEYTALVFTPFKTRQELDLLNVPGLLDVKDFVWQGVLHIWVGIDHVLFLIAIILPSVLRLDDQRQWRPVPTFRSAFWQILKVVTLFTLAHSVTLALAALELVSLPSRLVESVIAGSIVAVCLNNIRPVINERTWLLIFGFGLFHGLGFASVMGELPFRMGVVNQVILNFNIGVELGQLAIVAACFPVLFLLRRWDGYVPFILRSGSALVGGVALYWLLQRALGIG